LSEVYFYVLPFILFNNLLTKCIPLLNDEVFNFVRILIFQNKNSVGFSTFFIYLHRYAGCWASQGLFPQPLLIRYYLVFTVEIWSSGTERCDFLV